MYTKFYWLSHMIYNQYIMIVDHIGHIIRNHIDITKCHLTTGYMYSI